MSINYTQGPRDEAPTPAFQAARRRAETLTGRRMTKFFAEGNAPTQQPPAHILIVTESRLSLVPEPLLAQVQACEKAYTAGRWYIVVPAALWQSVTRLLG